MMSNFAPHVLERLSDSDGIHRQTGRTTRMFVDAIEKAKAGHAVTVLLRDESMVRYWKRVVGPVPGLEIIAAKINMPEFDWQTLKMTDHRANNKLFIDHDTFYHEYKNVIKTWTAYNLEDPSSTYSYVDPFEANR